MREKLIELMCNAVNHGKEGCDSQESCDECPYRKFHPRCLEVAWVDFLLLHGVTVPVRVEGYSFKGREEIDFDYEAEDDQ